MKHITILILSIITFCAQAKIIEPEWALYDKGNYSSKFQEGFTSCRSSNSRYGYMNINGECVIPCKYKLAFDFNKGTAIVRDESNQYGIIDTFGNYTLKPGNYSILTVESYPGLYEIKSNETKLASLFNGRQFITDMNYSYISGSKDIYPFIECVGASSSDQKAVYNTLTMELLEGYKLEDIYGAGYLMTNLTDSLYYTYNGDHVKIEDLLVSSNGNEVYKDSKTNKFGIRNAKTKNIITPAQYKIGGDIYKIWRNDIVLFFDSISPENKLVPIILNDQGKPIIKSNANDFLMIYRNYIVNYIDSDFADMSKTIYYDFNGRELKDLSGAFWLQQYEGIYTGGKSIFDLVYNRKLSNVRYKSCDKDMLLYEDLSNEKYYLLNRYSGKIFGPFDYTGDVSEGIVVVEKNKSKFFIDRNGNEYHLPNDIIINGDSFHEGVISVELKDKYINGFIYNPLGHDGYVYNQKDNRASNFTALRLFEGGQELCNKNKYALAIDKYYQSMMLNPEFAPAFNNYAYCLFMMDYDDEALTAINVSLEHWPDNNYALDLKDKIIKSISKRKNKTTTNRNSSASIWDAIGNFANALMNVSGEYVGNNSYNPTYGLTTNSESLNNQESSGNYESQYRNWERKAESHYNSLTNLGYNTTDKKEEKSGNSGKGKLSSGNYVQQKRSLREAQNKMRSIRQKAASAGITINKSQWESATVSF